MGIRTAGDLKAYLTTYPASPEEIAKVVGISNMTVRRLLKKNSTVRIPKKYWPLFDRLTHETMPILEELVNSAGFEKLMEQVERDGGNCKNPTSTLKAATEKAKTEEVGAGPPAPYIVRPL